RVPLAKRPTSHAPRSPSRVLPAAMASEVPIVPDVVTLTTKAPAATAIHARGPTSRSAARAIPVAGHTAVALALTNASCSPSFPARMYRAVMPAIAAHRGGPKDAIRERPPLECAPD